jgi:O-antigen/teichoic acid export membrane protein
MADASSFAARAAAAGISAPASRVSLRRNVLRTFSGNVVYGACQWAMLSAVAKLGTPEMVGQFALAFAITAPVIMAADLHLGGLQATDARGAWRFGDYLALRLSSLAVAAVFIAACVAALYRNETGVVVAVVGLAKVVESISGVYLAFLQRHERMDWSSRSVMIKGVASLVALVAGLAIGGSLRWGVAGLALAWAAVLVLYDVPHAARLARAVGEPPLRPEWRLHALGRLAVLTLPLGLAALLASLQSNVPRYLVVRILGERELGFFAAASYLIVVGGRFMTALGVSAAPRLARHHAAGDARRFARLVLQLLATMGVVAAGGVAVAWAFGGPLLAWLYRPEYATQAHVLVVLMAAAALSYGAMLLQFAMTASRALRPQPLVLAAATAVTSVACLAWIPERGNLGAALAMALGFLVHLLGNAAATAAAVRRLRAR